MNKYSDLIKNIDKDIAQGVGNTPLIYANNISTKIETDIFLKLDSTLPYSHTFKDRGAVSAVSKAKKDGHKFIICASCGNMSSAIVPLAAKAGLKTYVIVSSECNLPNKVAMATAGAEIIEYDGRFDEIDDVIANFSEKNPNIPCINTNYMGYYAEGLKSLYYELFDELSPIYNEVNIVVPTADGTLITSLYTAYKEYKKLYPKILFKPHFIIAQPNLCSPLVEAFDTKTKISKWIKGKTNVLSLAVELPKFHGENSIKAVKNTNGVAISVNESKVQEYIKLLAQQEGIFTDDVGGVCIGSLFELKKRNLLNIPTICLMTGNGLKTYKKNVNIYRNNSAKKEEELFSFLNKPLL